MKICFITTFPPSGRQLNEYGFHIARQLREVSGIKLTILADELTDYEFATNQDGKPVDLKLMPELQGFEVIRCWKFGSLASPWKLLNAVRKVKPDVVWFNLVFSSFGGPENPLAAFAGMSAPALTRAAGFYTHVTLHHIYEHVDLAAAGVHRERLFRFGAGAATRALLKADSVSVLLSSYRRTLVQKYSARNVVLGTHGTFAALPRLPDFSGRGNPTHRILAIGHWGTYKRLETLIEALPIVVKRVPNAELIIAGSNHHSKPGYWESIRDALPTGLPVSFRGYVPANEIPGLFKTSSVVVMPYNSSTGSSGPAHQACEFGVPIVCADIADFRDMAENEDMAISFYKKGDADHLAERLVEILQNPEAQFRMGLANYEAGMQMNMEVVVRNYLRWFELRRCKRELRQHGLYRGRGNSLRIPMRLGRNRAASVLEPALSSDSLSALQNGNSEDSYATTLDSDRQRRIS